MEDRGGKILVKYPKKMYMLQGPTMFNMKVRYAYRLACNAYEINFWIFYVLLPITGLSCCSLSFLLEDICRPLSMSEALAERLWFNL